MLHLRQTSLTAQGICEIARALHGNTLLENLSLAFNQIADKGATALVEMLLQNKKLKILYLQGTLLNSQQTCAVARALHNNTVLENLSLAFNPVGDEGATALADMLLQNKRLKILNLRDISLNLQQTCEITRALHSSTTLETLSA